MVCLVDQHRGHNTGVGSVHAAAIAAGAASVAEARAGWSFVPDNHLQAEPHACEASDDCSLLRRYSPNGMLNASRALAPDASNGTHEWVAAWGGWEGGAVSSEPRCSLVVTDAAGSRRLDAAGPLQRNEAAEPLKQSEATESLKQSEAAEPLKQR